MTDTTNNIDSNTNDKIDIKSQLERLLDYYGDGYTLSENIFDLIEDFASSDAYSDEDVESLNNLSERELIEQFEAASTFNYYKIGKYHVLIWV